MGKTYFVTGTDTDVGKTLVSCGLLEAARKKELKTLGLKPVAAGCEVTPDGLRNEDALRLMGAATLKLPYDLVNPVALEPAIAPHIAARKAGVRMTVDRLAGYCRGALFRKNDLALIEGAGGWRVPLNDRERLSGLPKVLNTPIILVVGVKLGSINHTLLTVEAILHDGLRLAGWVANQMDSQMSCFDENLQTLMDWMPAPCLGVIPFLKEANGHRAAEYLDISTLL